MAYNRKGYNIRALRIQEITEEHYEPENHAKCYKQVWKKHVFPLFGIGYRSYLKYLKVEVEAELKQEDTRQLRLFD
jgi:hypothetical protein